MGAGPGTESEIKLRVPDGPGARARLAACGATLARARHFEDNLLFDDARGGLRASGRVLRLRRTRDETGDGVATLTFKGRGRVEAGVKSREETESTVADADALQAILEGLGYQVRFRYQKYRETWRLGSAEVVIDETPVGCFFEIEARPEDIPAVAAALGYAPRDFVLESYAGLFFAAGGQGDMVFT